MDERQIELWPLRVFSAVAATRSMTDAAARLGLTQSAVSQAMRRLEASMGVQLLVRGRRPVVLTAAGTLLERRAEALLRDAARLPHELQEAARMPTHEIRLGFVDSFASTAGPELIRSLSTEAVRVVVWSGLAPSLGAALLAREVDLIVTPDTLDDVEGLVRLTLWREPYLVLVPRSMLAAARRMSLEQLAATLQIIRFSARSHTGLQVDRHLRRIGVSTHRRIEVDGSDALVAMVGAGLGWALATPLCLLQGVGHAAKVAAIPLPGPGFSRTLSMFCQEEGPAAFAVRAAAAAETVLRAECLRRLRTLMPDLVGLIDVPSHGPPTAGD